MKKTGIIIGLFIAILAMNLPIQAQPQQDSFNIHIIGSGKDMILIPGLMSDQRVWEYLVEPLSSHYRLHLVNLAGFSGHPALSEPDLVTVKEDLQTYIRENELVSPIVMGHSVGGFLAMWLAVEADSQIGPVISVDGLPFYTSAIAQDSNIQAIDMLEQAEQVVTLYASLSSQQIMQMSQQGMYLQTVKQENIEKINAMMEGSDGATIGNAIATLMTTDLRRAIQNMTQPLLLLGAGGPAYGTFFEPKMSEIYQQQLELYPHAQLKINWNSGHFISFDEPEWLLEQIQTFLQVQ